jgi:PKD repeat protein
MKIFNKIAVFIVFIALLTACETDKDLLYSLDYITAPENVTAVFDITQDNTGLVSIVPNAEGSQKFMIQFGDGTGDPAECIPGETVTHIYDEGIYTVTITAVGITGLETAFTQDLNVTFKAPENLEVDIVNDEQNPKIVRVNATADYVTVFEIWFGESEEEEPVLLMPGEVATYTYAEAGSYDVRVVAKSAGAATSEYTETVIVPEAADPVNLPVGFESFTVNYAFVNFGNAYSSVIDNPDISGINTSARVGQTHKIAGAETWAGSFLTLETPIDFSTKTLFKVKVWSPKVGATVKLKVENLTNGEISHEVDAVTTAANQWEELSFDFSAMDKNREYQKVVIFFDFGNVGEDALYYFDDIKLVPAVAPSSVIVQDFEGDAPQFTVFGNIPAVEVIANPDVSGVNNTAHVVRMEKSGGAETWAGAFFETATPLDFENFSKIRVKTWAPESGVVVKLKLENSDASITHEVDVTNTTANGWEELVYDFSEAPAADYMRVVIFFDFGNGGDGSVYYFDQIELISEGSSTPFESFMDFEATPPAFTVFGNIPGIEVIANPDASGVNTTDHVAKMVKSGGAETWAGAFFEQGNALDLETYSKISVKIWSPKSGIVVKLKLENSDASITHEVDVTNTTASAWEDLVYDFSTAPAADYVRVVIFFDFGNSGDDSVYYFDEFALTN